MPSQQDRYLQHLIDSYREVEHDIRVFVSSGYFNTHLATNEERDAYNKNLDMQRKLLIAMGQEFPALWERFQNSKAREERISTLAAFDLEEMGQAEKILRSSDPPEMKYD